jgi:drug/metabolite transporter (DMT)-like permease
MSRPVTYLLLVLAALLGGASYVASKVVVSFIPPFAAAAMRFWLAALVLVPIAVARERQLGEQLRRNWPMFVCLGVVGVAGFNGLLFNGLRSSSAINAALIMATNPLVTMILASLLLHEPLRRQQRVGGVTSLLGVLLVINDGRPAGLSNLILSAGDGLLVGANLCWALYCVLTRRHISGSSSLTTTTAVFVVGAAALTLAACTAAQPVGWSSIPGKAYVALGYLALCGSAIVYLLWNVGFNSVGVARTSMFFNLVPVSTGVMTTLMGAPPRSTQLAGGALTIAGVVISMALPPARAAVQSASPSHSPRR